MRFLLAICIALLSLPARAQAPTEAALIGRLVEVIQTGNQSGYLRLFPDAETIAKAIMRNTPPESAQHRAMARLLESPDDLGRFDAGLDSGRIRAFDSLRAQGDALGLRWRSAVFARYELEAQRTSRDTLWSRVARQRFLGYVFIQDVLEQQTYGFTVGDVMQIDGKWYGGTLSRVFEAATRFDFDRHLAAARKAEAKGQTYLGGGAAPAPDSATEEEAAGPQKVILERRFLTGTFDDEIRVQLYIRGLKGDCPKQPCLWEAMFKFGDQDDWVPMTVTIADGRWVLAEDPGPGAFDLQPQGRGFTGTWESSADGTGYEVKLEDTAPSNKKLREMDALFLPGFDE